MADKEKKKRVTLNTTVNEAIKDNFQEWCKNRNVTMGFMLEIMMEQVVSGDLLLRFVSHNHTAHETITSYDGKINVELDCIEHNDEISSGL